ncbi:glycosyltransferase family 2 protein [Proteiniclasticum sp. C24MP]|uniref:glycosyltransferase family 2 protein n=1 Tax=Proteiniclasticum sp. C24MP TaxID=3374101 RepID=UPI00375442F8
MIKLSIIIPHYNSPKMLKKLLSTIPKISEIQIVVVDDLSDKNINAYLQVKETNKGVVFLENTTGIKGAGACRNIGLDVAQGDWVLFADSDDYFLNGFYGKLSKYFDTDNDVVFFVPTSYDLVSNKISDRHSKYEKLILDYLNNGDEDSEAKLRYEFLVPWTKLINNEFIRSNHLCFDEVLASNDVMFSTKVGHKLKKFAASDEKIYCVTRSKGTLTRNISEIVFDSRLFVHIEYCKFVKSNLKKTKWKNFRLDGRTYIIAAIKQKYGFKKVIWTFYTLKKNRIKIMDAKFLNPVTLLNKIIYVNREYKRNNKYFKD